MCGIQGGRLPIRGNEQMTRTAQMGMQRGGHQGPQKPQGGNNLQIGNMLCGAQGVQGQQQLGPMKEGDPQ